MEGNLITVALIGSPDAEKNALFHALIQGSVFKNLAQALPISRGTYRYRDEEYLLLNLPETASLGSCPSSLSSSFSCRENFTMQLLSSGRADSLLIFCNALCLEQGLKLLSQLLKLPAVKEQAVPALLCINFNEEARVKGIAIDFDLLEDVLQIPVLPCYLSSPTCLDDIKTAVSAVWSRLFSYECLDFSPKKLAAETTSWVPPKNLSQESFPQETLFFPPLSPEEKLNLFCLVLFLFLFLLWLFLTGGHVPSLCLWRILYWLKKRLGAVFIRFILTAFLS